MSKKRGKQPKVRTLFARDQHKGVKSKVRCPSATWRCSAARGAGALRRVGRARLHDRRRGDC